jgi:hypothetical protein
LQREQRLNPRPLRQIRKSQAVLRNKVILCWLERMRRETDVEESAPEGIGPVRHRTRAGLAGTEPAAVSQETTRKSETRTSRSLLSAHRRGDFRVISAPDGDGYSGALSSMSRCV